MRLLDIVRREPEPEAWSEGEKIPWNDPGFSERMLKEHLTDRHDAASRRASIIDCHVSWIHHNVLSEQSSRILDLACGPGLYASRLAQLGHECVGIDFAPASIEYAVEQARDSNLKCRYVLGDIRDVEFGDAFDLIMLIFGELNVFRPTEAATILRKSRNALRADGQLLLEMHTLDAVQLMGTVPPSWQALDSGLFSLEPHLLLQEAFWDPARQAATTRYYVVEAESGHVERFAASVQGYTPEDLRSLLSASGFEVRSIYPSLTGEHADGEFVVYIADAT